MKHQKILSLTVCAILLLCACSKKNYPVNALKKQLTGRWQLVSQGGGFGNLPETKTEDNIAVEFTANGKYRNFRDGALENESPYTITYTESAISGKKRYVIVLQEEAPYLLFTVSDAGLTLSGDHVDAMYFKYVKIED